MLSAPLSLLMFFELLRDACYDQKHVLWAVHTYDAALRVATLRWKYTSCVFISEASVTSDNYLSHRAAMHSSAQRSNAQRVCERPFIVET